MDDIFDFGFFDDFDDGPALPPSDTTGLFTNESFYTRSHEYWMQVPLPPEHAPVTSNPLANLDDETLLNMSPTLIVHVQRTAAMNGMQVTSPRAMSLASMASRTDEPSRTSDMFLVGSNANRNLDWPVLGEPMPSYLFPGEPIDAYPSEIAARPKVVTTGLVSAIGGVRDPVLKAFIIGRACVDLQRRADVCGSADALSKLLAGCWGISQDDFDSMSEASLAPVGPLLRYAIRADETYPTINAPIHARKVISVAANTSGRELYGEYAAIDWRRLRVLAESVYYMSVRTEGYSLSQMALSAPPGDPRADPLRPGVLQFRPKPGTVWSYDPSTFRIDIADTDRIVKAVDVPYRVHEAMRRYFEVARPLAIAADMGVKMSMVASSAAAVTTATGEAVIAGYQRLLSVTSAFSVRGKTSSAAVRDFLYQYMATNASLHVVRALWMIRFLRGCTLEMGITDLLDIVATRHVATRLVELIGDMRMRLAVEAGRRGATLDEWWDDLRALLPSPLSTLQEGTASWAQAVAHLLIHPPTHKWDGLSRAMAHASHASLASMHVRDVRLPIELRSTARVYAAADATARSLARSYGAFYGAMFDVAGILAAQMKRRGNFSDARKMEAAGAMWDIRAKLAATARLELQASKDTNQVASKRDSYRLACNPYAAYLRWRSFMYQSRTSTAEKMKLYPHHLAGKVSQVFVKREEALFPVPGLDKTRLYRYVQCPARLGADLEKTMLEMCKDVAETVRYYEEEEHAELTAPASDCGEELAPFVMPDLRPAAGSFWDVLATLEQSLAMEIDDLVAAMPENEAADIRDRIYNDGAELTAYVFSALDGQAAEKARVHDVVN